MRVNLKDIISKKEGRTLFIDLIMMILLIINLGLILFDLIFSSNFFKGLFQQYTPAFYEFYDVNIHQDFIAIDLWFVTIFIIELLVRWIVAVKNKKYHRWFFYPFMHWYDVLGCLPLGSLRLLRVLRIIGLTVRLHKLGVIDITKTYPYRKFVKYLNILTEEVSDRVVIHVLSGIQDEIKDGTPVIDRIVTDLVMPRRTELVEWISYNLQESTRVAYENHIGELQDYINEKLTLALESNAELKAISKIPIMGGIVTNNLERTICEVVDTVVDECFRDLASPRNQEVVNDVTELLLDNFVSNQDEELNELIRGIVINALDLIKEQVRIQQWKIREELKKQGEEQIPDDELEDLQLTPLDSEEVLEVDHQND